MRLSSLAIVLGAFIAAGGASFVAAGFAVTVVEDSSEIGVRNALDEAGLTWAEVQADGLQVTMTGTAASEAQRFRALSVAGTVVDAARVIDNMSLAASEDLAPPRFSVEMLRNDSGISLIGLIPAELDREALLAEVADRANGLTVSDLLETADHPLPPGFGSALIFGIEAMGDLPRSKISVDVEQVTITAMTDSEAERDQIETRLARTAPPDIRLALDVSAPRPVITPFTLRFILDGDGPRFDACSADTDAARDQILGAAIRAGLEGKARCTIGLGVPSPQWSEAVAAAIDTVSTIGGGSVTFSDADVTLVAPEGTSQAVFDRAVGELDATLPDVFALHAVLPETPEDGAEGPPEFLATLSPEGQVQIRGRIGSEIDRMTAESFARARLGSGTVYMAARVADGLPEGWTVRALAGIEALSHLSHGAATVTPDSVTVRGDTGDPQASDKIARILSDKLGEAAQFEIDVTYLEKLDPVLNLPTPEECAEQVATILSERKLNFEPGSATPDAEAAQILNDIADVLKTCEDAAFEIGGHTDSQGREVMNQQLSQARADAILAALRERRVLTANLTAVGYGEEDPIADNGTEEGREANRRIEFKLIQPAIAAQNAADADTEADENASADEDTAAQEDTADEQD